MFRRSSRGNECCVESNAVFGSRLVGRASRSERKPQATTRIIIEPIGARITYVRKGRFKVKHVDHLLFGVASFGAQNGGTLNHKIVVGGHSRIVQAYLLWVAAASSGGRPERRVSFELRSRRQSLVVVQVSRVEAEERERESQLRRLAAGGGRKRYY